MKIDPIPTAATLATLQDVIDGLDRNEQLSATRTRDLRSAVVSFTTLAGRPAAAIPSISISSATSWTPSHRRPQRSRPSAGQTCAAISSPPSRRPGCGRC